MRYKAFVTGVLIVAGMGVWAFGAERTALRTDHAAWSADPTIWEFRREGVGSIQSKGQGFAVYHAAPAAFEVTVEAVVTPHESKDSDWDFAGIAVVDSENNYWQLALVESPDKQGNVHGIQLAERRAGQWMAQENLRRTSYQSASEQWAFNQSYRLRLDMDRTGITGTVTASDGRQIFRSRYAFNAAAVQQGRPALKVNGTAGDFTELYASWDQPVPETFAMFPAYTATRFVLGIKGAATGFFHVTRTPDGTWWTIDPLGRGFVPLGVDHVKFQGPWCEKLGYCPYGRNNESKYSNPEQWETETLDRLKQWGFTMLGTGSDPSLYHRGLGHMINLQIGTDLGLRGDDYTITANEYRPGSAFPNVFHPNFEAFCRYRAQQICAPNHDDPWLFGYFIDNELAWWGRAEGGSVSGLFDAVMKKRPEHSAKTALRDFLKAQAADDIQRFNALWNTHLKTFDELLSLTELPSTTEDQLASKRAFLRLIAKRYFSITSRAIREADPNHLVLGARFAGTGSADSVIWEEAGKWCDVLTFNCYPSAKLNENCVYYGKYGETAAEHFERYYGYTKRPMLITEWSFPALDSGLPCLYGAGQRFRTQAERTQAASLFARTMLGLPFLLGYDWFMWVDEPALGISEAFPENSNYGLVNQQGVPYSKLTGMFSELNQRAGELREHPELPKKTDAVPCEVPNALAVARRVAESSDSPAAVFERDGNAFRLANNRLELTGSCGDGMMIRKIRLDGKEQSFGRYTGMIRTVAGNDRKRWSEIQTVRSVSGWVTNGIAVVDVTGVTEAPVRCEVTHRLILPPGVPWFIAEAVRVKNVDTVPVRLDELFFRFYSSFEELPNTPPRLWELPPSACWMNKTDHLFFGAVAPQDSEIQIRFWEDKNQNQHPDAKCAVEETFLSPGAVYEPENPAYVIGTVGTGQEQEWLDTAFHLAEIFR